MDETKLLAEAGFTGSERTPMEQRNEHRIELIDGQLGDTDLGRERTLHPHGKASAAKSRTVSPVNDSSRLKD